MSTQLLMVLALLAVAIVMFAVGRPRADVVGLLMMAALPFTGAISVQEALAGFSDPNMVLIALLFVIGEGLVRTGVAQRLGLFIVRCAGGRELALIVGLMLVVATVGSVMSSTGVVALFIPIVLGIVRGSGIPAGRLMMPLSVAALVSGMMTLVATAPNLVVNAELIREGHAGFGFFAFLPFGLPVLLLATAYMLLVRRWLPGSAQAHDGASRPKLADWIEDYRLAGREYRAQVSDNSPLVGRLASELEDAELRGMHLLAVEQRSRFGRTTLSSPMGARLAPGDALLLDLHDPGIEVCGLLDELGLRPLPLAGTYFGAYANDIGMAEAIVPANSSLVGASARQARLRASHELAVIGLKHGRTAQVGEVEEVPFAVGDTVLLVGPWNAIRAMGTGPQRLVLLELPAEFDDVAPSASRAPFALACLLLTIGLMVSGAVANVHAALLGCLLMGLCGCVDLRSAYRAIQWPSLILIIGMLPFSIALQRTGGVEMAANALLEIMEGTSPRLVLAAVFAITAVLGMFISNTAVAVLMAPVALAIASHLGVSPHAFAMTVALAASTAFMTPVSSPVNALVVGPGGYRFNDFMRIGAPLAVLVMVLLMALVPVFLPL